MSSTGGAAQPESISLIGFVDRFIETHERMSDRAFAFVLGAGASRSSGIKPAAQMVGDWVKSLYREATGDTIADGSAWASAATLGIPKYDPTDSAASYPELYQRTYRRDPQRGYAYLEEQMQAAEPSYGYSVLARIMENTRHRVVVTTNFDNLVADSLSIFSKTYPLVCGHESLAGFINARMRRPLVVKVHRDLLLAPRSTPDDIAALPEAFASALRELFRHFTPIVIGYAGNDGSLMAFLKDLPPKSLPGGVYWCSWEDGPPPSQDILRFVADQDGCLVPIPGFDETMMLLGDRMKYDVPDEFLRNRANTRADRIVEQAKALRARLTSGATMKNPSHTTAPTAMSTAGADPTEATSSAEVVKTELAKAMQSTMQRTDGERRWWQWEMLAQAQSDPNKREEVYKSALDALPNSAPLLTNYAKHLWTIRKDKDAAEAMYKRALFEDPAHPIILGDYATFLTILRKDPDKAEVMYKRALDADPTQASNLCHYASFLKNVRRNYDVATEMYKRALEADPTDVNVLGNYAILLTDIRKEHDAAESMYKRALAIDPNHAHVLGVYANFLTRIRKEYDAAEAMYKRAIEADPNHANNLGYYANFLVRVREDHDAAEAMYKRAIEADPIHAKSLGNYASFLRLIRKDHDAAEAMYKRAIEADPIHAKSLSNYAVFLTDVRKDHAAAEAMFKRAIEADPTDANNLGNYTKLLFTLDRVNEGLAMLDTALAQLDNNEPGPLDVELHMYATCHWLPDRWREALSKLKPLLTIKRISTGAWDFGGVIASAKKRGHPDAAWLEPLAAVCAGTADPSTLDAWDAWKHA